MAIKVTMNLVVLSLVVVAAALVQGSRAETHVVGDTLGWVVPPGGSVAYTTWAATKTFAVGDVLLFNYTTGEHDVVVAASKTTYDSCSATNALSTEKTGPTSITLTSGEHFYFCSVGTHCSLGQKLAINVSTTATSSPSPTGNTTTSPPPPSSAAQPLAAALPLTLVSIFVALLH
ncbi:hypothetical protein Vadar_030855 [Vaccinium darrowii]|uniref:Uncharacterized protein n=1 Tax=Vaccinium darrowii TaxID=229202 RepID=A0ACB7YRY8_9ERIC|nr:hypothetical protein Vadar_030855 [Vaccinium darrowii]